MLTRLELAIAMRYLRGRRGSKLLSFTSVIAIGGVVVGVSALIVVMGIMNGLQRDLREKIEVGGADVRLLSASPEMRIDDWAPKLKAIEQQPGVAAAGPFVATQCLVNAGHVYGEAGNVVGLPAQSRTTPDVTGIRHSAIMGDFRFASSDGQGRGIALGKLVAGRLGAFVGDSVTLTCIGNAKPDPVVGLPVPVSMDLEVTGVFETGLYQYDDGFMYVALPVAQQLAGVGTGVTGIEVKAVDRTRTKTLGAEIVEKLGPSVRAIDWQEQNKSLFAALNLEKLGMGLILFLIVLVAAFNIVSNLTMVVVDKTSEIGILKAMGLTSMGVSRVFLAQGLVIGAVGTGLGVVVGIVVSLLLGKYEVIKLNPETYSIDHVPVVTAISDVGLTILASLIIAAVATLYPSVQAGRLYPIEAIRHD